MAKRKAADANGSRAKGDSSDDDASIVDVDFEWFDPEPVDFHAVKRLLQQLFDVDNDLFDLSALTDLILSQPDIGSTVKSPEDDVDTSETDPWAIFTVISVQDHAEKKFLQPLISYLAQKSKSIPGLEKLDTLIQTKRVGLVLAERVINMPPQTVPPSYKFLIQQIRDANAASSAQSKPFDFSHMLILSKTYTEVDSTLDDPASPQPPPKRSKKSKSGGSQDVFYFHAEDEVFARHAVAVGNFEYSKQGAEGASDSRRAFQEAGIRPVGHLILMEASKFEDAVKDVDAFVNGT